MDVSHSVWNYMHVQLGSGILHRQKIVDLRQAFTKYYIKWLSESYKKIYITHGTQIQFSGGTTMKDFLVNPKDRDISLQKSGVIYRYKCDRVD